MGSAGAVGALALVALVYAIAMAAQSREPYGDSARSVYAFFADLGLGLGALLLTVPVAEVRRRERWRTLVARWEVPIYVAALIAIAAPLVMSSANSLAASSIGEGGASPPVVILGGIGLGLGLTAVMTHKIVLGLSVAAVLGSALMAVALATAR